MLNRNPNNPNRPTKKNYKWNVTKSRMWTNAQRDGRPAEYRWRPLFNGGAVV